MQKFLIRNDDVGFDTTIDEIKEFCKICDKYNFKILHAITPIGELRKIKSSRMTNDQIIATSNKLFSGNKEVSEFLLTRQDLIGVHGLWHTHQPTTEEIRTANIILKGLGFNPSYYIPPFNEGDYIESVEKLVVSKLSMKNGERLEDYLENGTPVSEIMYLHSWRFVEGWYTFDMLEQCLKRLSQ